MAHGHFNTIKTLGVDLMEKFSFDKFQDQVDEVLIRHKSILDILTKLQESSAKVNRAAAKSVTHCGCVEFHSKKQSIPEDISYSELRNYMSNHIEGYLCDVCREKIEEEISTTIFYITALCNSFNINIDDMLGNYTSQLKTLGKYGLL